ncbi:MAG: sialate O-acetylesterase [Planctomycetaceae bacterium]
MRLNCLVLALVCVSVDRCLAVIDDGPAITAPVMEWIRVSDDGTHFTGQESGTKAVFWGANYDHDGAGRLIEDYWFDEWDTVVEDFGEMKALNLNVVRIHLQLSKFMKSAVEPDEKQLAQLAKLVKLAEQTGLYLDLTGLGCYHKQDVPDWYDPLSEEQRWEVQSRFWSAVAVTCRDSSAVFCYDLMNEPILPGKEPESEWLTGELGGKHFVQRISLDLHGRTRNEVAAAWVRKMSDAIRSVDKRHLITVGVIPWAQVFPGAKPLFYSPDVVEPLDFVSVHFYPKKGQVKETLEALAVYDIGKPIVIEEIFPLSCGIDEADEFISQSRVRVDGWISFYWGKTIEENEAQGDIQGAIIAQWLTYLKDHSPVKDHSDGETASSPNVRSSREAGRMEPVDVYLLAGQSNMQGNAKLADVPKNWLQAIPAAQFWTGNAFETMHPGMLQTSDRAGEFGPEVGFAVTMTSLNPNQAIYIVKFARSGQPLHHGWNGNKWEGGDPSPGRRNFYPGRSKDDASIGTHYRDMIAAVQAAFQHLHATQRKPVLKGIVWMQGEQDSKHAESATSYASSIQNLKCRIEQDLSPDSSSPVPVPFVMGQILPYEPCLDRFTHRKEIREQQWLADMRSGSNESVSGCWMISTDGLPLQPDTVHYDAAGQLMLGQLFAIGMKQASYSLTKFSP